MTTRPKHEARRLGSQGSLNHYALVNGAVFNAYTGQLEQRQAVEIKDDRIVSVKDAAELPAHLMTIDVTGYTLLPGFIDVHVHTEDWHAPLYLAKGITTVRDVGCQLETILARRARWNSGDAAAPRLICTGPMLDGPGNTWRPSTMLVQIPAEARAAVDALVERGVDQIKAYAFLDWPCFTALVDQAHKRDKFVVAHLGKHTNAHKAIKAGLNEIEHLSGMSEAMAWERNDAAASWDWVQLWAKLDADRMDRLIDLILSSETWLAVTRLVWLRLATIWDSRHQTHAQMKYVPGPLRRWWETRFPKQPRQVRTPSGMSQPSRLDRSQKVAAMTFFTSELIRRKAKILIGTDAPFPYLAPGFSFHDELQALLECGMDEATALQAATRLGAQALEVDHLVGTIEPAKQADLVIVKGDPTADIQVLQQIEGVIHHGRWFDPEQLLVDAAEYATHAVAPPERRFDNDY